MLKKLSLAAAITGLTIGANATDISLLNYDKKVNESQEQISYYMQSDFFKNRADSMILEDLKELTNFIKASSHFFKTTFSQNFDRWVVEDSEAILPALENFIKENETSMKLIKRAKKIFSDNFLITKEFSIHFDVFDDLSNYYKTFLKRAEDAKYANDFMNTFIKNNQQVLKALA